MDPITAFECQHCGGIASTVEAIQHLNCAAPGADRIHPAAAIKKIVAAIPDGETPIDANDPDGLAATAEYDYERRCSRA